jgi:magnesium transporter
MDQHISCRVFRGGSGEEVPFEPGSVKALIASGATVWIDVVEEVDASAVELEGLLTSTLGDVVEASQFEAGRLATLDKPPKVKVFDDSSFVRLFTLSLEEGIPALRSGEVHVLQGSRFIVTVRYVVDGVAPDLPHEALVRWDRSHGRVADQGGVFMLFALLEEIIDDYLDIVERFDAAADELESRVLGEEIDPPDGGTAERHRGLQRDIIALKRDLGEFRRLILPYGEVKELTRDREGNQPDFREIAEGILRVVELVDNVRDLVTATFEAEQAQVSIELNENMKKITSWGAILLVPTLIAGIYGMNFRNMPELGWGLGYPGALGLMVVSAGVLFYVFKRREWL